jgi:hypothetical protein
MKIQGYCLEADAKYNFPAIPIAVVASTQEYSETPKILGRDGESVEISDKIIIPIGPPINPEVFEIPEGCWLGIGANRECVVLTSDDEPKWRVAQAAICIDKASRNNVEKSLEDTIRNVSLLHAGAALVGLKVSHLFETLSKARKSPNEPLEVTIRTIISGLKQ